LSKLPTGVYDPRVGLFDFFKRRRERESAIPGSSPESLTRQLKGDGKPIGQPVGQAFPQAGPQSVDLTAATDLAGVMAMMQQAFQTGEIQVTQGEKQVIDLRGSGLREQIMGALEQHGIDPEAAQGGQINASDVPGLQEQIMQALQDAGVDVGQLGNGAGEITIEGSDSASSDPGSDSGAGGS
jgi:hypothetical protein